MARYTGPKTKIARKFGEPIFGDDKSFEKRNYPPGQHGNNKRRSKKSEYAIQLMEKQKAKYTYGVLEKQFRNLFKRATASKGITGEVLLQLCESRLDNVVYRMGFASTRAEARQLVSHKSILVNGKVVNIPSFQVSANDEISVREKAKKQSRIQLAVEISGQNGVAEWVDVDNKALKGVFKSVPARDELSSDISEQLIVELYSK